MQLPSYESKLPRLDPNGFKRVLRERRASYDPHFASGVWRLMEVLPAFPSDAIVTLAEGNMPLYASRAGAGYAGVDALAYLHLGMNPTGSFKDLGMTVAISAAKASGARAVACASTGNTASSMAAYAARAGLEAYALVPRGRISKAKLAQMLDYGAKIVEVDGSFDDAFARLGDSHTSSMRDDASVTVVNSINPYRLEGQKCAAYAMLEARSWRVPDWVLVPGGNLGNASAIGKGFREARGLGLIDRLPRLAVVQAAGAAPFARAWSSGDELVPVVPRTSASAIAVGSPKSWRKALLELQESDGVAIGVEDEMIDDAKAAIGAEGIGCEPASAATLAGARVLCAQRVIAHDADVVAILTGHVLKDSEASLRVARFAEEHARAAAV